MIRLKQILTEDALMDLVKAMRAGDDKAAKKARYQLKRSFWDDSDIDKALSKYNTSKPSSSSKPSKKWNDREYKKWIKSVAAHGGSRNAYDMARNAEQEPGLIDFVKKTIKRYGGDESPLERIQWDIEAA